MKYKSCHLIEHGISIDVDSIKACCLSREFDKGQLMIIPKYENNKIFWDDLFEIKKEYPLFSKEITKIQESINLTECSFEQLANIIKQLLTIYHCNSKNGNLKEFGLSDRIGRLSSFNITGGDFIFTSVTGLKEKTANYDGE